MTLNTPVPITIDHEVSTFDCGVPSLNDWLRQRAVRNSQTGASRTYVVTNTQAHVVGYYCLSAGSLAPEDAPGAIRRNMPASMPMVILGRLSVDHSVQSMGLGSALLADAVDRATVAASIIGVRGILVHALSEAARAFYERHGFRASCAQPMTLVLSLQQPTSQLD